MLLMLTFSDIQKISVYWKLEWEVGCQTCCLLRSKTYLNFRCVVRLFCSAQGSHLLTDRTCGVDFCKYDDHIKSRILCCFINPVLVARPLIFLLRVGGGGDYYSLLCTSAAWALRLRGSVNILRQISQKKLFSSVCIFICPFCSCWGEFPFQVPLYVWWPGASAGANPLAAGSNFFKSDGNPVYQVLVLRPIHIHKRFRKWPVPCAWPTCCHFCGADFIKDIAVL